jgi:hypothetical protein
MTLIPVITTVAVCTSILTSPYNRNRAISNLRVQRGKELATAHY